MNYSIKNLNKTLSALNYIVIVGNIKNMLQKVLLKKG